MPRESTLDKRDETRRARATGDGNARQCRTPVALGAQRSVLLVKGGIARAPGSQNRGSGHVACAQRVGRSYDRGELDAKAELFSASRRVTG
jgi:hypothetical protein